jgi:ribonuclease BN (tRNA processing enzyme)
VLTHIPPWTDPQANLADAREVYAGPVELAAPRASYDI